MAEVTIPDIDEALEMRLRARASRHGRSVEEEARDILRVALATGEPVVNDLGRTIHARFATLGGVDLPEVPRGPIREPADFDG
ncbi:FitA-like ribbon-helix-helix domain-containing protein [Methylobacterium sp. A54F]